MLFKVAWRNVWRSRTRSLVVIGAIIIGVWSILFLLGFMGGFTQSYVNNAIENQISHLQLHAPQFMDEKELKYSFEDASSKREQVATQAGVEATCVRTITNVMLASSKGARGIIARGVDAADEAKVTKLDQKIVDGTYFNDKKNPMLLSKRIVEKLGLKVRSKVVLTFQDFEGEIVSAAFRVAGIFDTGNAPFDESTLFIKRSDINRLLGREDTAHEIAVFIEDIKELGSLQSSLQNQFPDLEVANYQEISPDVQLYETQSSSSMYVLTVIFMLALIFGIINTMLMAVLERVRELGMLMAVGMNKGRVFSMVVLETVLMTLIGVPIGLLLGFLTTNYFANRGIDLSAFSEGMQEFGMSEMVYPKVDMASYIFLAVAVGITAILASIYPAFRAIRLRPVEAIRKL